MSLDIKFFGAQFNFIDAINIIKYLIINHRPVEAHHYSEIFFSRCISYEIIVGAMIVSVHRKNYIINRVDDILDVNSIRRF